MLLEPEAPVSTKLLALSSLVIIEFLGVPSLNPCQVGFSERHSNVQMHRFECRGSTDHKDLLALLVSQFRLRSKGKVLSLSYYNTVEIFTNNVQVEL